MNNLTLLREQKSLFFFLGKALLLYVGWSVFYANWLVPYTSLEEKMTTSVAGISASLMKLWGFSALAKHSYNPAGLFDYSEIYVDNVSSILIGTPCNGLSIIVLFAGFIIAYPGNGKLKLLYIVAGSFVVYAINLIRIQLLILNFKYSTLSFDFNHKYTYTIVVYLCIFMLWLIWANRLSMRKGLQTGHANQL